MKSKNLNIFLVSFLTLFLEMFIIRWISTEIRIFAYVSNLALLACFIGIGLGCYLQNMQTNLRNSLVAFCFLILASKSIPFRNITEMLSGSSDFAIWFENLSSNNLINLIEGITLSLCIFSGIVMVFFPFGQILGKLLDSQKNIVFAYSINVSASILGIWTFSIFSFLSTPPLAWLLLSLTGFIWFAVYNKDNLRSIFLFSSLCLLLMASPTVNSIYTRWSPYQKLDIYPNIITPILQNGYIINVNNVNYMSVLNLSPEFIEKHRDLYNIDLRKFNQYEFPFFFCDKPKDVLIVGAGAGNDAAGALRSGAENIDAVEIDPDIYWLGLCLHPEKPYFNKKVNKIIDDARSYFKKSAKKYDVISFGLADSHTLSSSYNNLRLDHYLYTLESFQEAKNLLSQNGVLTVIFDAKRDWIAKRIFGILEHVFNTEPITLLINNPYGQFGWGGIMFIVSDNPDKLKQKIDLKPDLKDYVNNHAIKYDKIDTILTTDDWPYLYLKNKSIPILHLCITISLLLLFYGGNRILFSTGNKLNFHFFFLGTAFLLLEFQNISKSCLLFGSTWLVNAYIISAILFLILLSNIFVYYFKKINIWICYFCLLSSTVIQYLLPLTIFNIMNYPFKEIVTGIYLNIPIFFAGIIFIQSFKNSSNKSIAFGSNLLGASFGGLLESVSFIAGIKSLLILVFIFYILSFLFIQRKPADT